MSFGVSVNPDCQASFLKMAEGRKEFRYIVFRIDEKEVVVEKTVRREDMAAPNDDDFKDHSKAAFEEFVTDLKTLTNNYQDCRYAVFDFKFMTYREGAGESRMEKIVFIQLCPDGASIKKKMVYASSASAIKQALGTGKILAFQVSDESELSHTELLKMLKDKYGS